MGIGEYKDAGAYVAGLGTHCGKQPAEGRVSKGVYHSAALLTGSGLALSPHSSNRCLTEKIFSQLEQEGRENICFTIHHTGGGEN